MPIAFDASSSGAGATATLTYAHTTTGANRILFVGVSVANASDLLTGITYNGVALTFIAKSQMTVGLRWAYLYYLIAPATGANNIVVSLSGSATVESAGSSYTGAKQSAQPDNSTTNTNTGGTSITTALTTVADNCWMVSSCQCRLVAPPIAGTNVTKRTDFGGASAIGDSNAAITPAGSFSQTWTQSGLENFNVVQASFAPATTSIKTWDGLAYASVKTVNGLAQASIKNIDGLV